MAGAARGAAVREWTTSADGTRIGYRRLGRGPGLVIVHGAWASGADHLELAGALGGRFTVTLPDRRGRGLSGPHGEGWTPDREVEDLRAVLGATGASAVFGVSAGGIVALETALVDGRIEKLAVFEPPLAVGSATVPAWRHQVAEDLERGAVAEALVTGTLGSVRGAPTLLRAMPRGVLRLAARVAMAVEASRSSDDAPAPAALAPTVRYDAELVRATAGSAQRYAPISIPVLLLGGSRSPRYLGSGLAALAEVLPGAQRIELPGMRHSAPGRRRQGGRPREVAARLVTFLES